MNMRELNVCEGCLSVDRNLVIFGEELCSLFCYLLGTNCHVIKLCWECAAYLKRFVRFKQQVRQARDILTSFVLKNTTKPLTNLSITECNKIKDICYDSDTIKFIKTEDTIFDSVYVNNVSIDYNEELPNPSTTLYGPEYIENRSNDDFNDSDEEPLKVKKDKNKPHEKRKKKEQNKTKRKKLSGVVNNARVNKKLQQLNVSGEHIEMVILTWNEVEEERQRALESETFTRHEYKCYDCVLGFNHRCKLEQHMKKHEPCTSGASCVVCRVVCRDARALAAHCRRHRVRWRCRWCGGTWSRAAVCADHATRTHRAPPPTHTCARCGHTETSLGKLRNHIKNHSERQKCELCGKTFRDKTSLKTHLFIHKGEKEYSCPRCDKKFLFKKAMEIHLITHDAPAHLYCYQCDMNFKNRMSYNQHMKYNLKHIDPARLKYACKLCDKKFVKAIRLEEHNMAVHLKITPITCPVSGCNFACSSKPVLRSHARAAHRLAGRARNHVCDVCGKTFTSKKSLEGHLRSHAGSRPLRCDSCPASFAYEAALYNHNKLVHLKRTATSPGRRDKEFSMDINAEVSVEFAQ